MPQPDDMVYLVNQFNLNDGTANVEIAEFGIYGSLSWAPADSAAWDAALAALATASISTWAADVGAAKYSPGVQYGQAIATRQNTSGLAVNQAREVPGGTPWTGSAAQSMPWETAVCINLYGYRRGSFAPLSRRKRGRIYLPPLGATIMGNANSGKIRATDLDVVQGDIKTWLSDLATTDLGATSHRWEPQILSKVGNMVTGIVQLSTDDRWDSQRRRERQMPVTIHSVDFP